MYKRVIIISLNWSTTSTVGTVDHLRITRLALLDICWCTASGSPIKSEGLWSWCTSHCRIIVRASLYSLFAFIMLDCHCVLSSFGNPRSLCLSISPSTMDLKTMMHAEIQSEDELTITNRAVIERS